MIIHISVSYIWISTDRNIVPYVWISTAWVMWSELFFWYAQCNYIKGLLDFCCSLTWFFLVLLAKWNMELWHLVTSLYAALVSLGNCYLFATCFEKMLLHADCIAPVTNKSIPEENLSDLVNPLHWHSWSRFNLVTLDLTDAVFVVLGCQCTKWVPANYIISKFDHEE